jgi:hypothetical protein
MRLARRSRFDDVGIGGRERFHWSARPSTRVSPSDKRSPRVQLHCLSFESNVVPSPVQSADRSACRPLAGGPRSLAMGSCARTTHVVFYRAGAIEKHSAATRLRGQARTVAVSRSPRHSNPLSSLARVWRLARIVARKRRGWTATQLVVTPIGQDPAGETDDCRSERELRACLPYVHHTSKCEQGKRRSGQRSRSRPGKCVGTRACASDRVCNHSRRLISDECGAGRSESRGGGGFDACRSRWHKTIVWSHSETAAAPVIDRSVAGVVASLSAATRTAVDALVASMTSQLTTARGTDDRVATGSSK